MANRPNQQTDRQKQPKVEQMTQLELPLEPMKNEIMTYTTPTSSDQVSSPSPSVSVNLESDEQKFNDIVKKWLSATDFKRLKLEKDIFKLADDLGLNFNGKKLQEYADSLQRDKTVDDISNLLASGKEYFDGVDNEVDLLLPFIGIGGVGILYGRSTTQKSSFLYSVAKSIAINDYSDWSNQKGKVLVLQLEESQKITNKRFVDVVEDDDFCNIVFYKDRLWTIDQKSVFVQAIERVKPKLVIIDSLSKATRGKLPQQDSAYADFIFDYQDIANQHGLTIIFNHHELKNTKQFAGTQKIMDNVDFMFHWEVDNGNDRYLTVIKNRLADDSLNKTYKFTLDFENDKWSYHGEDISFNPDSDSELSELVLNECDTHIMQIIKQNWDQNQRPINKASIIKQHKIDYPSCTYNIEDKYGYSINKLGKKHGLIEKKENGKATGWIPKQHSEIEDNCIDEVESNDSCLDVTSDLNESINR